MVPVECRFPPGAVMFPTGVTPRFHEFYDSLDVLQVPDGYMRMRLGGPDCDTNRNKAVRLLDPAMKWVLFLDDDQVFDAGVLLRMLEVAYSRDDIHALTGWYTKKSPSFEPVLYRIAPPDGEYTFERMTFVELTAAMQENPLFKIGGCGGGILLVKRETLDAIGDPWFNPGPGRAWGGDLGLGQAMFAKGLNLWVDLRTPVGHCMPVVITPKWDPTKQEWLLRFKLGDSSFTLPSSLFPEKSLAL